MPGKSGEEKKVAEARASLARQLRARLEFIFLRSVVTEGLQLLDAIFHMRYAHTYISIHKFHRGWMPTSRCVLRTIINDI